MDQNSAFKLPADLVMHVLEFLDPVDILAMRATCRTFYRLAAFRSVWIAALNRVCEQHGIYKPTYPMEKMTLAELERAASGPHRFIRFVNKSDTMPPAMWPQPYPTRQFHWRTKSSEAGKPDPLHSVSQLAMVPGGRFLVTTQNAVNDTTTGITCLWDLGYDMYTPLTPFPIATMTAPSNVRALAVCPSLNGKNIIVAMYGSKRPSAECFLKICSISPLDRKPEFVVHLEQQQLPPFRTRPFIRLNEPIVLVKADSAILVWNWANGTGCRWDYTSLDHGAEILLYGNTLVATDKSHDFVIWDIPERLSPIIPQQGPPSITNPPKRIRRMHVTETNLPRFSTTVTPSWQRHTVPYFCFLVDEQDNAGYGNIVCLHSLRRIWSHDRESVTTYLPVEAGECAYLAEDLGAEIEYPVSPLIFCDGRLVLCSVTMYGEIVATVLPDPTAHVFEPCSAFLLQDAENGDPDFVKAGFCPCSGRFVAPKLDGSLQIVEFLLPMDERSPV